MIGKIKSFIFPNSPSPAFWAFYILLGILTTYGIIYISGIFTTTKASDQYDAIAVWQNNSEGNWDIAYSIYRQNGDSWFYQENRDMYYEGQANLIAKIPGDDIDPDIASTKQRALAVWSNNGGKGNKGADIYLSFWNGDVWEKPSRLFAMDGDDIKPSVYMLDQKNAMVVWVNDSAGVKTLWSSEYVNGVWNEPELIRIDGVRQMELPDLGYVTLPYSKYLLSFIGDSTEGRRAFIAVYDRVNGWQVEKIENQGDSPLAGSNFSSKISSSMHVDSRNVAIAWAGSLGDIWLAKATPANKKFSAQKSVSGALPLVLHDPQDINGTDTMLFTKGTKLLNITPADNPSKTQTVSDSIKGDFDATYLREQNKNSMLAVFRDEENGEGEIYFSSVDKNSQNWSQPKKIDTKGFFGDDKNPAVAPILIKLTDKKTVIKEDDFFYTESFCGDTKLDVGEECEVGVACKNSSDICEIDYGVKTFGPVLGVMFGDCVCYATDEDNVGGGSTSSPKKVKEPDVDISAWAKGLFADVEPVVYRGAACGFDEIQVKETLTKTLIKFVPGTRMGDVFEFSYEKTSGGSKWNVAEDSPIFALFPRSKDQPDGYIDLFVSKDKSTVTMTGVDAQSGFQLCEGTFTKNGNSGGSSGLMPAPAPSSNTLVPALPAN